MFLLSNFVAEDIGLAEQVCQHSVSNLFTRFLTSQHMSVKIETSWFFSNLSQIGVEHQIEKFISEDTFAQLAECIRENDVTIAKNLTQWLNRCLNFESYKLQGGEWEYAVITNLINELNIEITVQKHYERATQAESGVYQMFFETLNQPADIVMQQPIVDQLDF